MFYRSGILVLLIACCGRAFAADQPTDVTSDKELIEGWRQEVDVPESKPGSTKAAKLKLWIEQNWLVVRREKPNGYWDWQIVLAFASNTKPPQVKIGRFGAVEVSYGQSFIRETEGQLRVLRERKTERSPAWPTIPQMATATRSQYMGVPNSHGFGAGLWKVGNWWFFSSGVDKRSDTWVRLNNLKLANDFGGHSAGAMVIEQAGDYWVQDEGDLLVARRLLADDEEVDAMVREKEARAALIGRGAPALEVRQWLNSSADASLEKFRGKVMLLYFWDDSSSFTSAAVELANSIAKQLNDANFATIGIYCANSADNLRDQIKSAHISKPIGIDSGGTAKKYLVDELPRFFLIDRTGVLTWGFSNVPPTEKQIEDLLK